MQKWSEVTREERFFTAMLFQAVMKDPGPMTDILRSTFGFSEGVRIVDVGYEVCYFRDAWLVRLIQNRQSSLEHQTFDLVFWLSDGSMVIVEAKAQQAFDTKQVQKLKDARPILLKERCAKEVLLLGLHSSNYHPTTASSGFDKCLAWNDLVQAGIYPTMAAHFSRADSIYRQ